MLNADSLRSVVSRSPNLLGSVVATGADDPISSDAMDSDHREPPDDSDGKLDESMNSEKYDELASAYSKGREVLDELTKTCHEKLRRQVPKTWKVEDSDEAFRQTLVAARKGIRDGKFNYSSFTDWFWRTANSVRSQLAKKRGECLDDADCLAVEVPADVAQELHTLATEALGGFEKLKDLVELCNRELKPQVRKYFRGPAADDAFQHAMVKVIEQLRDGKYNPQGKFISWFLTIARNEYYGGDSRQREFEKGEQANVADKNDTPVEEAMAAEERKQQVRDHIMAVLLASPVKERLVFLFRHHTIWTKDFTFKEIIDILSPEILTRDLKGKEHPASNPYQRAKTKINESWPPRLPR